MEHEEIVDMLGAYAIDAIDEDERAEVEDHLRGCARCRAEVQEHREVATFLAHTGGDAPEGLWEQIAGSLEEAPPGLRLVPADPGAAVPVRPARHRPRRQVLAVLAAAAVVAVVALLGLQVRDQGQRIEDMQEALADPTAAAFQAAVTDPASKLIQLESADGTTVVRGAISKDGTGYLRAASLPSVSSNRTYQLWGLAGDNLVSLGVLGDDPSIITFPSQSYDLLAITEEDAPGVVTSSNQPVVSGSIV